eukprot:542667_1
MHSIIKQKDSKYINQYLNKILWIIEPQLIDENRTIASQIIKLLCDKVGIAQMLSILRHDLGNEYQFVTNVTANTLAIVGIHWGMDKFLPFLKGVCESKKCSIIRNTGIKIIKHLLLLEHNDNICLYLQQISQLLPQNRKYVNGNNENIIDRQGIGSIMFIKSLNKFVFLGVCQHVCDNESPMTYGIQYCNIDEKNKKISLVLPELYLPRVGRCICPNAEIQPLIDMDAITFQHFIYIFYGGFNHSIAIDIIDTLHNKIYRYKLPFVVPDAAFYVLK